MVEVQLQHQRAPRGPPGHVPIPLGALRGPRPLLSAPERVQICYRYARRQDFNCKSILFEANECVNDQEVLEIQTGAGRRNAQSRLCGRVSRSAGVRR